jgi:tetratricopeptide (TPR) repeat protein
MTKRRRLPMKKKRELSVTLVLCMIWVGFAWGHGAVSALPDSVQIEQYTLKIWLNPDDFGTRNKLAMALYRSDRLEEAEKELRYILGENSEDFDALDGMGIVLIEMEKYQEALEYLTKAARINEKNMMVHVRLSVVYQKMKLPKKAQSELEKARSLTSDPAELEHIEQELHLVGGHKHDHEH